MQRRGTWPDQCITDLRPSISTTVFVHVTERAKTLCLARVPSKLEKPSDTHHYISANTARKFTKACQPRSVACMHVRHRPHTAWRGQDRNGRSMSSNNDIVSASVRASFNLGMEVTEQKQKSKGRSGHMTLDIRERERKTMDHPIHNSIYAYRRQR